MQLKFLNGYPDYVGKRFIWCGSGVGPVSYVPTTGDLISFPRYQNYIDLVTSNSVMSVSGLYLVRAQPSGVGSRQSWSLRWFYVGGAGSEGVDGIIIATAGSGQTNGVSTVTATGGGGSGATVQITIAGGLITAVKLLNPGTGYTSVPTFTVAQGGTPGTLTATIGSFAGEEVASGVNLSGESVQIGGFGGQY